MQVLNGCICPSVYDPGRVHTRNGGHLPSPPHCIQEGLPARVGVRAMVGCVPTAASHPCSHSYLYPHLLSRTIILIILIPIRILINFPYVYQSTRCFYHQILVSTMSL